MILGPIDQARAREFIRRWHRHLPHCPPGWRWGHGLWTDWGEQGHFPQLLGCAWVGRPVARKIDQKKVVEVNRLCVRPDMPDLTHNVCSRLYGAAAREARKRGYGEIITYIREDESGISLRAAGWMEVGKVTARQWSCPSRHRMVCTMIDKRKFSRRFA